MEKFSQPFEGSNTEPGKVAVAFYAGIFSYSGWLVSVSVGRNAILILNMVVNFVVAVSALLY